MNHCRSHCRMINFISKRYNTDLSPDILMISIIENIYIDSKARKRL